MVPVQFVETVEAQSPEDGALPERPKATVEQSLMEQRVTEIDDVLMLLRMEMTVGKNLPWSAYESRMRVEPIAIDRARTTVTCLAAPTAEPALAKGMLKGLILLSLQTLKQRVENS